MKSWKTTLGGALAALGQYLETIDSPTWLNIVGRILSMGGVFLLGITARDNRVTSEDAGIK